MPLTEDEIRVIQYKAAPTFKDLETILAELKASRAREERLRAFAEDVRDNWGALPGYELKRRARDALAEAAGESPN